MTRLMHGHQLPRGAALEFALAGAIFTYYTSISSTRASRDFAGFLKNIVRVVVDDTRAS